MEAVEELARQAGMQVPKPTPQAAEAEQRRAGLSDVLEAAGRQYQAWLAAPEGRAALDYLRGRGLTDATIRKFGLGWSGEGRGALATALRGHNIKPDQLIEAGLMKQGDHGPVDMFFGRVMFPIRDKRGRDDQLRRADHGRWPAQIRQRAGDAVFLQAALALRAEFRPRDREKRRAAHCR